MKLGKREYKPDHRTLKLQALLIEPENIPKTFDYDRRRVPFPLSAWGNMDWGDCVMASRANQTLRLERMERRRTPYISDADVVEAYKAESAREFGKAPETPDDPNDQGLYIIEALKAWRTIGWAVRPKPLAAPFNQRIAAFGEVSQESLRAAIYFLNGAQIGLALPLTAYDQVHAGEQWDFITGTSRNESGSWGGHCVYVLGYGEKGFTCLTWGKRQFMTDTFMETYCDERWAVVDELEGKSKYLDVPKLEQTLKRIGATQIEQ